MNPVLLWAQAKQEQILEKYRNAYEKPFRVVQLVTSQPKYATAETVNYSLRYLNGDLSLINERVILDVKLLNDAGEIIEDNQHLSLDGKVAGELIIPEKLPSGIYRLVAYSNYMKNYDVENFHFTEIEIVSDRSISNKINFEIEGGDLIGFLQARIKILVSPGEKVKISNVNGDEVASGIADSLGIFDISFTPMPSQEYLIEGIKSGIKSLGIARRDGMGVRFDSSSFTISLPPNSSHAEKELLLVVSGLKGYVASRIVMKSATSVKQHVDLDVIGAGPILISIFDQTGTRIALDKCWMSSSTDGNISVDIKSSYHQRETANIGLNITNDEGETIGGDLTVSVLDIAYFRENPARRTIGSIDPYLIEHNNQYREKRYLEKVGFVKFESTDQPVPPATQVLVYLQKSKWFYQTFTLDDGQINVVFPDIEGQDQMFYLAKTIRSNKWQQVKVLWQEDTENPAFPKTIPVVLETTEDPYNAFVEELQKIEDSYDPFGKQGAVIEEDTSVFENLIAKPDATYKLADYNSFQTIQEFIKEVSSEAYYRESSKNKIIRIKTGPLMDPTDNPLFIIDDRASINIDYFLGLDPGKIESIGFITKPKKLTKLGLLGRNGIIIVKSKNGDSAEPIDNDILEGLSPQLRKIELKSQSNWQIPIIDSPVYWNPHTAIKRSMNKSFSFFLGDNLGQFCLILNGVTNDGEIIHMKKAFNVDLHKQID